MTNDLLVVAVVTSAEVGRNSKPSDIEAEGWLLARGHQSIDRQSGPVRGEAGEGIGSEKRKNYMYHQTKTRMKHFAALSK